MPQSMGSQKVGHDQAAEQQGPQWAKARHWVISQGPMREAVGFGRWHFPSPLPSNGLEIHSCELCWSNGKSWRCFSTEASINQAVQL